MSSAFCLGIHEYWQSEACPLTGNMNLRRTQNVQQPSRTQCLEDRRLPTSLVLDFVGWSHTFTHWFAVVHCSLSGLWGAVSPAKCAVSVPAVRQPYGWLLSAGSRVLKPVGDCTQPGGKRAIPPALQLLVEEQSCMVSSNFLLGIDAWLLWSKQASTDAV